MSKKTVVVRMLLTPEQRKEWAAAAKKDKRTLSDFVRSVIDRHVHCQQIECADNFIQSESARVVATAARTPTKAERRRRKRLEREWEATGIEEVLADEELARLG